MTDHTRLLIADSSASIRETIRLSFTDIGWQSDTAPNGIIAIKLLRKVRYSLAIIDTGLPGINGRMGCRQLRKISDIPGRFISARGEEADRLAGFDVGGNDYVTKPFFPRELVARGISLVKLCGAAAEKASAIEMNNLRIELDSRSVYMDGRRISLSPREYDLLLFFMQHPNQSFSREQLLDCVWGQEFHGNDRTVDTHIKSLRNKLKPYQSYVETIWGYGYRLSP